MDHWWLGISNKPKQAHFQGHGGEWIQNYRIMSVRGKFCVNCMRTIDKVATERLWHWPGWEHFPASCDQCFSPMETRLSEPKSLLCHIHHQLAILVQKMEWNEAKKNSEQGREKGTAAAPSKYQKNFSKASNYIVLGIVYMFWTLTKLEVDQKFS